MQFWIYSRAESPTIRPKGGFVITRKSKVTFKLSNEIRTDFTIPKVSEIVLFATVILFRVDSIFTPSVSSSRIEIILVTASEFKRT